MTQYEVLKHQAEKAGFVLISKKDVPPLPWDDLTIAFIAHALGAEQPKGGRSE